MKMKTMFVLSVNKQEKNVVSSPWGSFDVKSCKILCIFMRIAEVYITMAIIEVFYDEWQL